MRAEGDLVPPAQSAPAGPSIVGGLGPTVGPGPIVGPGPTVGPSREAGLGLGWSRDELAALGGARLADLYTSEQVLQAERRLVLQRSWSLVSTTAELASPGDFLATEVAGAPVLVVRGTSGALAAFHNVCRHRGLTLAEGQGRLGRYLTCPYHQWSYRLDGTLAQVPQEEQEFAGLDKAAWPLVPVAVAEWHGMIYVRPSSEGPGFEEWLGALGWRLGPFFGGPLVEIARVEYEADCNWKFVVENHVDVYHLWYLHARSLSAYAHGRFQWEALGDNWWSNEPLKEPADAPAGAGVIDWVDSGGRAGIGAHFVFPNLMIVTTGRYFATYDAVPLAPDRCRLTLRIRSVPGSPAAPLVGDVRSFMAEDLEACRLLQLATASPAFGLGPMATHHEAPVLSFHASLRRRLLHAHS